jgi:hypothetical protein
MSPDPHPPPKRLRNLETRFTPVIIKFNDGGHSFKDVPTSSRKSIQEEIVKTVGNPRDAIVLRGGDLSVTPIDLDQQKKLLSLDSIVNRPVSCSLPNSSANNKNGVIFGVPIADGEIDLLEALRDQGVTNVKRLPMKNRPEIASETVILTFESQLPERVKIAAMSFRVQISIPNPYRCNRCGRLGHTTARCGASSEVCKTCSRHHQADLRCSLHCINCNGDSHTSLDNECPAYKEMRKIIRMAYLEGISIEEAKGRSHNIAMGLARRTMTTQPQPAQNTGLYQEMAALREQLKLLQEEVKEMRESTIPKMDGKLSELSTDLMETKDKVADFGERFNTIERQQVISATDQAAGFNRIEEILGNMMLRVGPTNILGRTPQVPAGMISTIKEPPWISHEPHTDLFEPLDMEHTDDQHV